MAQGLRNYISDELCNGVWWLYLLWISLVTSCIHVNFSSYNIFWHTTSCGLYEEISFVVVVVVVAVVVVVVVVVAAAVLNIQSTNLISCP